MHLKPLRHLSALYTTTKTLLRELGLYSTRAKEENALHYYPMHQLCKKHSWDDIMSLKLTNHTILLDIDGVLMAHEENTISPKILQNIQILKEHNDIHIVSNAFSKQRRIDTSKMLGIPWVDSGLKKPSVRILSFIKYDDTKPLVVIGDKILTDGIFAQRIHAKAFLLNRLLSPKDPFVVKATYLIDNIVYSLCKFIFAR